MQSSSVPPPPPATLGAAWLGLELNGVDELTVAAPPAVNIVVVTGCDRGASGGNTAAGAAIAAIGGAAGGAGGAGKVNEEVIAARAAGDNLVAAAAVAAGPVAVIAPDGVAEPLNAPTAGPCVCREAAVGLMPCLPPERPPERLPPRASAKSAAPSRTVVVARSAIIDTVRKETMKAGAPRIGVRCVAGDSIAPMARRRQPRRAEPSQSARTNPPRCAAPRCVAQPCVGNCAIERSTAQFPIPRVAGRCDA
jgi:hypothetical protein